MAAQDVQLRRPAVPTIDSHLVDLDRSAIHNATTRSSNMDWVGSAVRHRWWQLLLAGVGSIAAAVACALFIGRQSAIVTASLIHTGLPGSPGARVYEPLSMATCAEHLVSSHVIGQLREQRGLESPIPQLAMQFKARVAPNSSLINVSLSWSDAEEGVDVLNDTLQIFVNDIANQRAATVQEYTRHVEGSLLQARAQTEDVRRQVDAQRERQDKLHQEAGQRRDGLESMSEKVIETGLEINRKRVEEAGIAQQIDVVNGKFADLQTQRKLITERARQELLTTTDKMITQFQSRYASTSKRFDDLSQVSANLHALIQNRDAKELAEVLSEVGRSLNENKSLFSSAELAQLDASQRQIVDTSISQLGGVATQQRAYEQQRERLEFGMIPVKNQIAMLETLLATYQQQADGFGTGLTETADKALGELEYRLQEAQERQTALTLQLENLRELEKCRVKEWTVSVPASMETAQLDSGRKKVFAVSLGLVGLALTAPIWLLEWNLRRGSPQVRHARTIGLPILTERVLDGFLPSLRESHKPCAMTEDQIEALRMLTLRIQQSCRVGGSVVLFSSIDTQSSAVPLIGAIAKCLADREERVLIVDAVCPKKSRVRLVDLLVAVNEPGDAISAGKQLALKTDTQENMGLSEFLSHGCDSWEEVIQPSGCTGIDVITSGTLPFPREAMASSILSKLLDDCGRQYTVILVNGPPASNIADLQMLVARADGVIFTARRSKVSRRAHEAMDELVHLGAPIIGVVA